MQQLDSIGMEEQQASRLATGLNELLAHYQVLYMNVRGFHWNVKGEKFLEMHAQFEQLYNDLQLKIDEIAERILTLGQVPLHTYEDYLKHSGIKPAANVSVWRECLGSVRDAMKVLLAQQRMLLRLSAEADDEGTNALMSDYIRQQEKAVWMYNAILS